VFGELGVSEAELQRLSEAGLLVAHRRVLESEAAVKPGEPVGPAGLTVVTLFEMISPSTFWGQPPHAKVKPERASRVQRKSVSGKDCKSIPDTEPSSAFEYLLR
jgi:hypothetical protein